MNTAASPIRNKRSDRQENVIPFPRQIRRKNAWGIVRLVLVFVCPIVILTMVFRIPLWERKVTALVFEGHHTLSEIHLRDLAGITEDDNLWQLDLAAVRQRILSDPYVKDCSVSTTTNNAVYISITERMPVASVSCNNRIYEIDEEGVVLREVPPLGKFTPPLITSIPGLAPLQPGDRFQHEHFAAALRLWRALSASPVLSGLRFRKSAAFSPGSLYTYFDEFPCEVRWSGLQCEEQVKRFETLCAWQRGLPSCSEYIDMRFGSQVAVK